MSLKENDESLVTVATGFPGSDPVENVIGQVERVSTRVKPMPDASRFEQLGIDVVRGHVTDKMMTIARTQQKQGFVPKVSLSDGFRETIAWHRERSEL